MAIVHCVTGDDKPASEGTVVKLDAPEDRKICVQSNEKTRPVLDLHCTAVCTCYIVWIVICLYTQRVTLNSEDLSVESETCSGITAMYGYSMTSARKPLTT